MNVLLTNDDSHRSPLLSFIIEKLAGISNLTVVVPKHEQSWKGKAITRFSFLHAEEIEIDGRSVIALDGTPADCINWGIYHACQSKPDLVVSGINAGLNAGLGFIFSSGTVGACLEANIAGIPALALSQVFDGPTMNRYLLDYKLSDETLARLAHQTKVFLDALFSMALSPAANILAEPVSWNINFPFELEGSPEFAYCNAGHTFYGSCFQKEEFHYRHSLKEVSTDSRESSDAYALRKGKVSVSRLDIRSFGQMGGDRREAGWLHA